MADLDPSKKVADRYLKREVLGEGTYGVVYKAIDTQVGMLSLREKVDNASITLVGIYGNREERE